ncbi:hypothetical protein WJX72_011688 [[Myrmecia] bisecta]|uniref:TLC domain-containing protein n=1 Tax=[Myrmecia] bisecta TaxID=41462 RepID=A0AAW1RA04_9CHLO
MYGTLPSHPQHAQQAILAIVLSVKAVDWSDPLGHFGQPTRPAELLVLSIATGYFFYDTLCCLIIDADLANFLHHVCTLAGLAIGTFPQQSGVELTLCLLLMEVSNPMLHGRYLMRELGMKETALAEINQIAFVLTFFVCRILLGPFVVYGTLTCPTSHPLVKIGGLGIQVVSLFWFYKIAQVAAAKFGGKPKKAA